MSDTTLLRIARTNFTNTLTHTHLLYLDIHTKVNDVAQNQSIRRASSLLLGKDMIRCGSTNNTFVTAAYASGVTTMTSEHAKDVTTPTPWSAAAKSKNMWVAEFAARPSTHVSHYSLVLATTMNKTTMMTICGFTLDRKGVVTTDGHCLWLEQFCGTNWCAHSWVSEPNRLVYILVTRLASFFGKTQQGEQCGARTCVVIRVTKDTAESSLRCVANKRALPRKGTFEMDGTCCVDVAHRNVCICVSGGEVMYRTAIW